MHSFNPPDSLSYAAVLAHRTAQDFDLRGFSRAVLAQQRTNLPRANGRTDFVERHHARVLLYGRLQQQNRSHGVLYNGEILRKIILASR
jgi:hypothetical protein